MTFNNIFKHVWLSSIQNKGDLKTLKEQFTQNAHQWILCSEWVPSEWESKHNHNNP